MDHVSVAGNPCAPVYQAVCCGQLLSCCRLCTVQDGATSSTARVHSIDSTHWPGAHGPSHSGSGNDSAGLADSNGHRAPPQPGQGSSSGGSSGGGGVPAAGAAAATAGAATPAALTSGHDRRQQMPGSTQPPPSAGLHAVSAMSHNGMADEGAAAGSLVKSTAAAAAVAAGQAADGGMPAIPSTPETPLLNPFMSVAASAWSVSVADDEAGADENLEPAAARLLTVAAAAAQVAPTPPRPSPAPCPRFGCLACEAGCSAGALVAGSSICCVDINA